VLPGQIVEIAKPCLRFVLHFFAAFQIFAGRFLFSFQSFLALAVELLDPTHPFALDLVISSKHYCRSKAKLSIT
jgi:hypothetical protein